MHGVYHMRYLWCAGGGKQMGKNLGKKNNWAFTLISVALIAPLLIRCSPYYSSIDRGGAPEGFDQTKKQVERPADDDARDLQENPDQKTSPQLASLVLTRARYLELVANTSEPLQEFMSPLHEEQRDALVAGESAIWFHSERPVATILILDLTNEELSEWRANQPGADLTDLEFTAEEVNGFAVSSAETNLENGGNSGSHGPQKVWRLMTNENMTEVARQFLALHLFSTMIIWDDLPGAWQEEFN